MEKLAIWHYGLTHDIGEHHGTPWIKASEAEKDVSRKLARFQLAFILPTIEAQVLERVRERLKPVVERLERIRDLDEQTSDGSLGSLARYALDELATLDQEGGA